MDARAAPYSRAMAASAAPVTIAPPAVLELLEARRLWGRGLGWMDMHLLASGLLSGCRVWTLDKKLAQAARELGLR